MPTKLDEEHTILRYVPWTKLRKDGDGETVIGVLALAFELRPDKKYLSATWIEHFSEDPGKASRLHQAVHAIRASRLKPTKKSGFTRGIVGEIRTACLERQARVRFLHEPEQDNPAHSALRQWPEDQLLYERLAIHEWADWFLNRDLPDA